MGWKEDLKAAIEENSSATESAVDLIHGMADRIEDLIANGSDPVEMQAFADEVREDAAALAEAVKTNTPAHDEPPSVDADPVEDDEVEVEPDVEPEAPVEVPVE